MNRIGHSASTRLFFQTTRAESARTLHSSVKKTFDELRMVQEDGWNLVQIEKRKINKILAWTAVTNNGLALEHVPERIKDDDIEEAAVSQNGFAFQFVRKKSRDNEQLLIKAISQSKHGNPLYNSAEAVQFGSRRLRDKLKVMKIAISKNPTTYQFAGNKIRDHKGLAKQMVKTSPWIVQHLSRRLRGDMEIGLPAVQGKGFTLKCLSKSLQKNRKIVEEAGKNEYEALQFAGKKFQNDRKIYLSSILAHSRYLPSPEKLEFDDYAKSLINDALKYAGKDLQNDDGFRNEAMKKLRGL